MKITPNIRRSGISSYEQGFENFFQTLRPSLKLWDYFVNWEKVRRNSEAFKEQLNKWNSLLRKNNFDDEFRQLLRNSPEIVSAIPALIVRDGEASKTFEIVRKLGNLDAKDLQFDFSQPAKNEAQIELALQFVKESGLIYLFAKNGVSNLNDYLVGVEAGLDSNGRKNRSGTTMETVVESYLKNFLSKTNWDYITQATQKAIKIKWGFDVPVDKATRAFDFALSNGKKLILIEVNFYGGGGSKLKSTAGEYKGLHDLVSSKTTDFIWITDGKGWETTKLPLKSAYEHIHYVWNLDWLNRGYLKDLIQIED